MCHISVLTWAQFTTTFFCTLDITNTLETEFGLFLSRAWGPKVDSEGLMGGMRGTL